MSSGSCHRGPDREGNRCTLSRACFAGETESDCRVGDSGSFVVSHDSEIYLMKKIRLLDGVGIALWHSNLQVEFATLLHTFRGVC